MWVRHRHHLPHTETGGDSDGGYLASASDLMIGFLFIFIILVVVLALQKRQEEEANRSSAINAGAANPLIIVTEDIGTEIKKVMKVNVDTSSGVITLPEDVLFESGRAELKPQAQVLLAEVSQRLAQVMPCYVMSELAKKKCQKNPDEHVIETFFIEGHTDSRPMQGGSYDNTSLSLDRARAVERAMVRGKSLEQYRNKAGQPLFSLSAYADSRPLQGTSPTDGKNRRVDLRIVLSYMPPEQILRNIERAAGRQPR